MLNKYLIVNQSQQSGIETAFSQHYAILLTTFFNDMGHKSYLTPCYRLTNTSDSDSSLLNRSIITCNTYYNQIDRAIKNAKICQIDVHINSYKGRSKGFVLCHEGARGELLAKAIYKSLTEMSYPWPVDIQFRPELQTLQHSSAINVIAEFGFYDNQESLLWHYNNRVNVCKAVARGASNLLDQI